MRPKYGYGSQYGNMSSAKGPRSRTTRTDGDSDEIELGIGKSSEHFGVTHSGGSRDSDERALRDGAGMGMWGVQVDTKVVIERDAWNATTTEPGVDTTIHAGGDPEKR